MEPTIKGLFPFQNHGNHTNQVQPGSPALQWVHKRTLDPTMTEQWLRFLTEMIDSHRRSPNPSIAYIYLFTNHLGKLYYWCDQFGKAGSSKIVLYGTTRSNVTKSIEDNDQASSWDKRTDDQWVHFQEWHQITPVFHKHNWFYTHRKGPRFGLLNVLIWKGYMRAQ